VDYPTSPLSSFLADLGGNGEDGGALSGGKKKGEREGGREVFAWKTKLCAVLPFLGRQEEEKKKEKEEEEEQEKEEEEEKEEEKEKEEVNEDEERMKMEENNETEEEEETTEVEEAVEKNVKEKEGGKGGVKGHKEEAREGL